MNSNQTKKNRIHTMAGLFLTAAVLTFLDQWTKALAVAHLKDQADLELIPGVLSFHYLENRGAAFGMLQNQMVFFLIITTVIMCMILYVLWHMPAGKKHNLLRLLCYVLTAGAIGNLIDRIRLNYVVDFIYFSLIDFPVFNVADIYVTVSVVLFIIAILFVYKDEDFQFLSRKALKGEEK